MMALDHEPPESDDHDRNGSSDDLVEELRRVSTEMSRVALRLIERAKDLDQREA